MPALTIPGALRELARVFAAGRFACYLVGGAVRDMLLGTPTTDYDVATDAKPRDVMRMFPHVIPTGVKHGTVTVRFAGMEVEVTTFRADGKYSDSRHPDEVQFSSSIDEDLKRRDFTINAIALDLATSTLFDPHDGRGDLKRRLIRAIGTPAERFNEDGLRLLRACRFAAQLQFALDAETKSAMSLCSERIQAVSAERIQEELVKILKSERPSIAFFLMDETGLLERIIPELCEGKGVEQKGIHEFDVFKHSLYSCDGAPRERTDLRLAALFHDIGKPKARTVGDDGLPAFYRHEEYSEEMASAILTRLRFSNAVEASVCHLIRYHMFFYEDTWTDAAVRRFVARVGRDSIDDLFLLRKADTYGTAGGYVDDRKLAEFRDRIERVTAKDGALALRDLAIGGEELAAIGIPRGPIMGTILKELLETVLDDPSENTPERLTAIAGKFYEHALKRLEKAE